MKKLFDTYKQHYKALLLLGLPIVVGQLGVIVLGFADTLMIGHHSTEELGAASFVNNLFTLCIIFSTGFSYGLTPVVGGFYGNRRFAEAGQALRCSLVANVLVALLLTLVMAVLYFNVERLGQPGELLPLIKPYYLVLLASLVFVMPLQARLHAAGVVDADVQEAQCTGLARGYADGYGDRFLQSERRHGGLAGDTCPSIASDNAYYLSVHLHDVLWHGRCGCRACQQLQGAGRRAECAPLGVCRPSHHPVYGGGVAGYRLCASRSGRGMVYGQCGSVRHGCRSLLPVLDLPVRRWVAD